MHLEVFEVIEQLKVQQSLAVKGVGLKDMNVARGPNQTMQQQAMCAEVPTDVVGYSTAEWELLKERQLPIETRITSGTLQPRRPSSSPDSLKLAGRFLVDPSIKDTIVDWFEQSLESTGHVRR